MDWMYFDRLARAIGIGTTRRTTLGLGAAGLLGVLGLDDADAKKRKKKCKKCGPCQKCKKGKCKPKAAGTPCGAGKQCFANGECVACDVCVDGCPFISLQAALDASDEPTVQLCPGRYPTNVSTQNKSLIVIGAGSGAGGTILDGQGGDSVFSFGTLRENPIIELRNLTITGGASQSGAGIAVGFSRLTLDNVHLTENHATGAGGAINIFGGNALLLLRNSRITDNSAAVGGGIYNDDATVTLIDGSRVTGNSGNTSGGRDGYAAGGIHNERGDVSILDGSSVTGNTPFDCTGVDGC